MLKLLAIRGVDNGSKDPFLRLAVLNPLYRSMIRSLISNVPLLDRGGSSILYGNVHMAARSKKNELVPFTYTPTPCDPVHANLVHRMFTI